MFITITLFIASLAALTRYLLVGEFHVQELGLRFDSLSILMLPMVSLLGVSIAKYSTRYMAGSTVANAPQRFSRYQLVLQLTLFFVSLLVVSDNLILFYASWLIVSLLLDSLLKYFHERPGALKAARQKFVVSRFGDVFILLAIALIWKTFGTTDFKALAELAKASTDGAQQTALHGIAILVVLGAMTKSVQVPFHSWLPNTMESPTPVSAFMHAGIINAGGYLVILFSPIIKMSSYAESLLLIVGSVTAVYGALAMIAQNDIKRKLAFSTISQMGMMMFTCGLGAYSLALFHILVHSLYKAHAFLSTGDLVQESKTWNSSAVVPDASPELVNKRRKGLILSVFLGLWLIVAGHQYQGGLFLAYFAYAAVLSLGVAQVVFHPQMWEVLKRARTLLKVFSIFIAMLGLCMAVEYWVHHEIHDWVQKANSWSALKFGVLLAAYSLFSLGLILSDKLFFPREAWSKRLYFYMWNASLFYRPAKEKSV